MVNAGLWWWVIVCSKMGSVLVVGCWCAQSLSPKQGSRVHSVQFAILGLPLFGKKKVAAGCRKKFLTLNGSFDGFIKDYQKKV